MQSGFYLIALSAFAMTGLPQHGHYNTPPGHSPRPVTVQSADRSKTATSHLPATRRPVATPMPSPTPTPTPSWGHPPGHRPH